MSRRKERRMKVILRLKHIKKGKPNSPSDCPIALAIKEKGYYLTMVDSLVMLVRSSESSDETVTRYTLPPSARAFIDAFDTAMRTKEQRQRIRPFIFEMRRYS